LLTELINSANKVRPV